MTLVGRLRERRYAAEIDRARRAYERSADADVAALQLERLNETWDGIVAAVPFYRRLVREGRVPSRFRSLEEFSERVPETRRADVQAGLAERTSERRPPDFHRITGGSTSQPVQLPAWSSEHDVTRPDMWLGRSWYGVTPASRLFMLWGHSHLLGSGWRGWVRARRQGLADRALGYRRFSAYDMRPERLREAVDDLERFRPDYVIGYSVALARFAAANASEGERLRRLGLRVVVGAAEAFPSPESPGALRDLFGCPVAMEYGSVETALLAHTHPTGGYRVFWRTHLVEARREGAAWRVSVTCLFPRAFPLVRYDLGDEVELTAGAPDHVVGLTRIERVLGRCNDFVVLPDGTVVHSEAFTHVVRPCPEVRAYQVVEAEAGIRIDYLSASPLSAPAEAGVRSRLSRIHPSLEGVTLHHTGDLRRTIAGKTPMVVREVRAPAAPQDDGSIAKS